MEWMFFECLAVTLYDKSNSPRGSVVTWVDITGEFVLSPQHSSA